MSVAADCRLRLRTVRFKSGGELRVMPARHTDAIREGAPRRMREVLAAHPGRVAGCAIVIWGPDNGSCADMIVDDSSKIPSIMIPDFVRNRLLAWRIEGWTAEQILGPPPPDKGA